MKTLDNVRVHWYNSAQEIYEQFWSFIPDEYQDVVGFGGETIDGESIVLSREATLNALINQGHWGFCHEGAIHLWYGDQGELEDLIHLIAHELAHAVGADTPDILQEEERYAELVGMVARRAFEIAWERVHG